MVCKIPSRNKKKKIIICRLKISGSDLMSEIIATLRPLLRETILRGLSMRRILYILSTLKFALAFGFSESSEDSTITKSNMFQLTRR